MVKTALLFILFGIGSVLFCQTGKTEKVITHKLEYNDFVSDYSFNDTTAVIIDIFFDKKDNAATGEMLFLPITVGLVFIPQTKMIGAGTTLISFPLFLHGSYTLFKYRKRKLYKVLLEYKQTRNLPRWIRRKANKLLAYYNTIETEY